MTFEILLLLVVLGAALVLFSFEWIPPDVTALGLLLTIVLAGLLPFDQAFVGFGSDTVMLILGLLLLTAALERTGVVDLAGASILRYTGGTPQRVLLVIMLACAGLSAFMSNTAATAFFVPVVIGLAAKAKISPSKLLLPVAFASILSSSVTLISTSTNIVISGLMTRYDMEPMGMFELAPVGLPIMAIGLVYMLIGSRMLRERVEPAALTDEFGIRPYLTEILILPDSSLIGKTLEQAGLGQKLDLTVLGLVRESNRYLAPRPSAVLQAGDVLLVEAAPDEIVKVKDVAGIEIRADAELSDPGLQDEQVVLVEGLLLPRSPLIGRSLKNYRFRDRYGLQVLGINRHGETFRRKISQVLLRMGDLLLLQGPRERVATLQDDHTFHILGRVGETRPLVRRAPLAVAIFVGALLAGTFDVVPFAVAMMAGAALVFVTRCITPEEAYAAVEWKVIVLIGSMLGVGAAMEKTGAAGYLAGEIVTLTGGAEPVWILSGFFWLTVLLTQPMSNQAAAVVVLPVAVQTALQLDMNPRTFAMMIAVAASCSYLTPLEPSCLMVYGPGRYRMIDFLRIGAPLTLLIWVTAVVLVPLVWPLR
jgi:di/tricarboxylate transporter